MPFATIDRQRKLIIINAENEGFEGLHDISVTVSVPEFERPPRSSPIKPVINREAKFRVEIGPAIISSPADSRKTNGVGAERSSETLGI